MVSYGKVGIGKAQKWKRNILGNYPTNKTVLHDGMIYVMPREHSPNSKLYKGYRARAFDAFTGHAGIAFAVDATPTASQLQQQLHNRR